MPIVIDSFQWWLARDRNKAQKWAFWDSSSIEIRKNSTYVTINRRISEIDAFSTTWKINALALTNYSWTWIINDEINAFCQDWKVYNISDGEIFSTSSADAILNLINTNGYNYMITSTSIHRFVNSVRSIVLASNDFSSGWTWTNWSLWVHTPWSTVSYTQSSPIVTVVGERYHVIVNVTSQSAWTCTVSIGWATSSNLAVWRNDIYLTATTTAGVSFTPSSTSTIDIDYVRAERVSTLASPDGLWVDEWVSTLTSWITKRPVANFFGDLIIWEWTQVARYNKDWTTILYSSTQDRPVIGGLQGNVYAITQIGLNIYVWCNAGGNTVLYIWDWLSSRPSEVITNPDKPVINVALLNNQHYWWAEKWPNSQKHIFTGEGYSAQRYITSDLPKDISTETLDDPDRLALYWQNTNAIETFGDIVYFPWYGKIFGFGKYQPTDEIALNKEFSFNGTECTAMLTTTSPVVSWTTYDLTYYMIVSYLRSGRYYIWIIDFRDHAWTYSPSWYIESMEYLGDSTVIWKNQKKILVPVYLPHSSTSIKVYARLDQAISYTQIKEITTTDYPVWFSVVEIGDVGNWKTIQFKFELITSNSTYSPRLYIWATNYFNNGL